MKKERYVVLESTLRGMPAVVMIAESLFKEDGQHPEHYFPAEAEDARITGTATIQTDAEFLPYVLTHGLSPRASG